jgi:hypothetical protein
VAWTLLDASNPSNGVLDALPGWKVIYRDKIAIVHARSDRLRFRLSDKRSEDHWQARHSS